MIAGSSPAMTRRGEASDLAAARRLCYQQPLAAAGESFAFETTCAGRAHAGFLGRCKAQAYQVIVLFFWLPTPEAALARVAKRVREGGHDVAAPTVRRRYWLGLKNLRELYMP